VFLTNKPTASHVAMVHVNDPRVRWSVHAAQVLRIVPADDWRAAPPIDVLVALAPAPAQGDDARRLVIVRCAGGRETALVAAGPITVVDIESGDVLPLPIELARTTREISAIIVAADASLSLLLDPLAIATPDAALREEPCPSRS
jgi:hypothetical protein